MMRGGHNPGRVASFAKGRLKTGEMNATEARYAKYLAEQQRAGRVLWFKFEGIKLRLADLAFYTVDFFVMVEDGTLEAHEVKGNWEDDARLKIKIAQEIYPFRFIAIKPVPASRGGGWQVEDFEKAQAPLLPDMRLKAEVPKPKPRNKVAEPVPGISASEANSLFDSIDGGNGPGRRIK